MKLAALLFFLCLVLLVAWFPYHTRADFYSPRSHVVEQSFFPTTPSVDSLDVQTLLDMHPGVLKSYRDDGQLASTLIASSSFYYGLSPRLHLALLESVNSLLSDPNPPDMAVRQPFGTGGPDGFAAQVEWTSRELRAGLGPYERPPVLRFSDGVTTTLTLDQAAEGVAIQRFLAIGRTSSEWHALVERFGQVFQDYFQNELPDLSSAPSPFTGAGFLYAPWPMGTDVVHLAFFDHVYPTVDSGSDQNDIVVTYRGQAHVQYNSHDGHDYFFPDQPVGTPILASAPGIAYARTHRGNGVVILHDNGYETVYWHLDDFAPRFDGRVDRNQGVRVETGDMLGTSGRSGFVQGTPHLHFEVRHYGRQVDPYGWYGSGPDPCAAYAGCEASVWLWHDHLRGTYDFTPPDAERYDVFVDQTAPIGTLSVNPPEDLLFLTHFDGHVVQQVGNGFPSANLALSFDVGRFDQAIALGPDGGLTYPISDNLDLEAGSISVWAYVPEQYPANSINRHYVFAASANADDGSGVYAGTLALRRDLLGPGDTPRWNFWTTPQSGADGRHDLTVPDTLDPGWHHFGITWDSQAGRKALFIDGERVAVASNVLLPEDVGAVLQVGRFTYGGRQSGMLFDDLAIFAKVLSTRDIHTIFAADGPLIGTTTVVAARDILIDTNALDTEGGIVGVQLGLDGVFEDPLPYYDRFRWRLPADERDYTLGLRYIDRAGNTILVTQTVTLNLPPQGLVHMFKHDQRRAILRISTNKPQQPIDMQISDQPDFDDAVWVPLQSELEWVWPVNAVIDADTVPGVYVRLRDADGQISEPLRVMVVTEQVYLPLIIRP